MPVRKPTPQQKAAKARKDAKIKDRQHEAYRLWLNEKKSLRAIGEILNISYEQVRLDINAVVDRIADEFDEEIRTWRTKQIKRLMNQYDRFDRIANDAKKPVLARTRAGTLCISILKELNEVLGIKAAVKHELTGKDGQPLFDWASLAQLAKDSPNQTDDEPNRDS